MYTQITYPTMLKYFVKVSNAGKASGVLMPGVQ